MYLFEDIYSHVFIPRFGISGAWVEVGFSVDITKQLFKVVKPMHIPLAKYELELPHILTTPEKYVIYYINYIYIRIYTKFNFRYFIRCSSNLEEILSYCPLPFFLTNNFISLWLFFFPYWIATECFHPSIIYSSL